MLDFTLRPAEGLLLLRPQGRLTADDFVHLRAEVDAYLATHDRLQGVLVHARAFPGWEDGAGFSAHLRFVRDHHRQVGRLALVTDSPVAAVAQALGQHFSAATVRHFAYADEAAALQWLQSP